MKLNNDKYNYKFNLKPLPEELNIMHIFDGTKDSYPTTFLRNQSNKILLELYTKYNKTNDLNQHNINYKNKIKIVIYTPPISDLCGGVMVMHNLCKTLINLQLDNIIVLIYAYDHKKYKNNFCNNFFNPLLMDDNTIVIYPENIFGNPLGAKHCVRWILLDLGIEMPSNFYTTWNKNDLVYHWEPSLLKNSKQLVNIWINPEIKNFNTNSRNLNCYALKKMQWIPNRLHKNLTIFHDKDAVSVDSASSTSEIVNIFNKSKLFYCYDPNTFFTIMAPLCGAATVLHPIDGVSKEEYFKSRILYHQKTNFCYDAGIAYGDDQEQINHALISVSSAKDQFDHLTTLYQDTVKDFVNDAIKKINGDKLQNTTDNIYYANRIKNFI